MENVFEVEFEWNDDCIVFGLLFVVVGIIFLFFYFNWENVLEDEDCY